MKYRSFKFDHLIILKLLQHYNVIKYTSNLLRKDEDTQISLAEYMNYKGLASPVDSSNTGQKENKSLLWRFEDKISDLIQNK